MREIRLSGSEGGAEQANAPFLLLSCPPRSRRTPIRRANGESMKPSEALLHLPRIGLAIRRSPLLGGKKKGPRTRAALNFLS